MGGVLEFLVVFVYLSGLVGLFVGVFLCGVVWCVVVWVGGVRVVGVVFIEVYFFGVFGVFGYDGGGLGWVVWWE